MLTKLDPGNTRHKVGIYIQFIAKHHEHTYMDLNLGVIYTFKFLSLVGSDIILAILPLYTNAIDNT